MTRTQKRLLNKMDYLLATLQSDWQFRFMSKGERAEIERQYRDLQRKLVESY